MVKNFMLSVSRKVNFGFKTNKHILSLNNSEFHYLLSSNEKRLFWQHFTEIATVQKTKHLKQHGEYEIYDRAFCQGRQHYFVIFKIPEAGQILAETSIK